MKLKTRSVTTLELEGGAVLELSFKPDNEPTVEKTADGGYVVGYLVHDTDCGSPLEESEGMGRIIDVRNGHAGAKGEYAKARSDDPLAILLDVYAHSGEFFFINGQKPGVFLQHESWDTSRQAAIWVPDEACREHIFCHARNTQRSQRDVAVECAQQALDEFNKWLSGDCWGVCVDEFKDNDRRITEDACWGFVGREHAETALAESIKNACATIAKKAAPSPTPDTLEVEYGHWLLTIKTLAGCYSGALLHRERGTTYASSGFRAQFEVQNWAELTIRNDNSSLPKTGA